MRLFGSQFLVCSLVVFAAGEAKRPVTIEVVTAAKGRGLAAVWSPDGARFAFEEDGKLKVWERGEREVLSLDVLEKKAKQPQPPVALGWQNRNASEARMQWFPDNRRLLVAARGDLFEVEVPGGTWKQLTATTARETDPKLSPDGSRVAFRREHDLWVLELASGKERRLTRGGSETLRNGEPDWVYPEELSLSTAYWWSPDGRKVAYLQFDVSEEPLYPHTDLAGALPVYEPQRYPRAGAQNARVRLGVVAAGGGSTRWMQVEGNNSGYLARVAWLPGGREVAALTLNRQQNRMEMVVCSTANGRGHVVLTETDRTWINVPPEWVFLEDGKRFLTSSEKDGHRHLYLYENDGRQVAQLTRGEWDVTGLAGIDQRRGIVYYVSTEASPLERQLYRVGLNGGASERVTAEAGTHEITMDRGADRWVERHSSLTEPPETAVWTGAGKTVLRARDRKLQEEYDLQPVEVVAFHGKDGTRFFGKLVKPPKFDASRKYPLIVLVYGGPGHASVQNTWLGANFDQALAAKGFVVWQMDNRGSGGYGHGWESVLYRRLGKTELEDQKQGVEYLVSLGWVDPKRVGVHGSSYGGFMTIYSLLHAPEVFRVGVAGAPVTDWHNYDSIYTERYLGRPEENAEGYRASSVVGEAAKLQGKLLLLHNFEDDNVLFQNSLQMMDAFEQAGKQVDLRLYPQKTHGITGRYRPNLLEAVTAFFEKNLD